MGTTSNISDEKGILAALVNLLKTFPQHKVVTYNGTAADLVEIENAWQRLGLHREAPSNLLDRHADLFSIVRNNFRFPTYGLGLKDIAAYFGFIRAHPETGSFVIPMIYDQFLNPNPPKDVLGDSP